MRLGRLLHRVVSELVPARPVAYTRMAVGAAGLAKLAAAGPVLWGLTAPEAMRVPFGHATLVTSRAAAVALVAAWALGAAALLVGWRARAAAALLAAASWVTLFADQQLYSNHLYLLALMATLLVLTDSGAAHSVDARARGARPAVAGYPVALLRILVGAVYGFAALTKLNVAWLSGGILALHLSSGLVAFPNALVRVWVLAPVAFAVVLAEGFLAAGLFARRLRRAAAWCGVGLHFGIVVFLGPFLELLAFSLLMVGTYPLFFADRVADTEAVRATHRAVKGARA